MSKAKDIAAQVEARVSAIRISSGYLTDIGQRVFRGRRKIDPTHLPCIVIVEAEDRVDDYQRARCKTAQSFVIEGHSKCDPDHPNDKAHDMIADLKRAIFSPTDQSFSGLVRPDDVVYRGRQINARDDGTDFVSADIHVELTFAEDLRNP